MAIENMSRSLQDPLFDENINNASLSMSVRVMSEEVSSTIGNLQIKMIW